jgi:adenylate cyclase class 2
VVMIGIGRPCNERALVIMSTSNFSEFELKIAVAELKPIRCALRHVGATLLQPMAREINHLYDTEDGRFGRGGVLLRLRQHADKNLLTLKGPVDFNGAIKHRTEYETDVANPEAMGEILDRLGFRVVLRYEKDREEWEMDEISVVLDHTPMGDFVEVEGPPEKLVAAATTLGLDTSDAARGSYVDLWQDYRTRHPELNLSRDMVFGV